MIDEIFDTLPGELVAGEAGGTITYYFSLGESRKTVVLTSDGCSVANGRTVEQADCVCKTSPEFFMKIWRDGYRPGLKDFMSGTIKSNNPDALRIFLKCFGK